ncbi:MAG: hypothetical protein LBM59_05350 [Ruminococcus sp.]|jgi:hypothetical protein|nr:hypothetical protein [Ruminococcus sp.]
MDELSVLLNRRLIELECYKNLTTRLLHEPLETFPELLLERDAQLGVMAKTAAAIKRQGGDHAEITEKINALKAEIIELDKKAAKRVRDEMDSTLELIKDSEKSNKVATYIKSANFNVAKGAALNARS